MKRMGYGRSFLVYSFLLLVLLQAIALPAPAADRVAGITTPGTTNYPLQARALRKVGQRLLLVTEDGRCAAIDPAGEYGYFSINAESGRVQKVRLADLMIVAEMRLNKDEILPGPAAIDPAGQFIYLVSWSSGSTYRIIKIRLSDFQRVGSFDLTIGYPYAYGMTNGLIDPKGVYFYLSNSGGQIIKLRLSDFTQVATLTVDPAYTLNTGMIDPVGDYAYFATYDNSPGKLVKIRLADFTLAGSINIEPYSRASVMDPTGTFGYVCGEQGVVKVRLADLTRIGSINITGEWPRCAVMDPAGKYLYLGGILKTVSKVRLSDFSLESQLGILPDSAAMPSASIAPSGDFGYFTGWGQAGTNDFGISVFKVALDNLSHATHATKITLPESAAIHDLRLYSHQAGGSVRLALYNNGNPRTLLWQSASTSNTVSNGWIDIPVASGSPADLKLRAGTYWLAFASDSTKPFASYIAGAAGEGFCASQPYGALPASLAAGAAQPIAGHWSQYLTYTPTFIDTPPTAPTITLSTTTPGTLDSITAAAASTDPDTAVGDSVTAYRYEWSLGGVVKSTSSTLAAALTARGQQWTCTAWACDTHGEWSAPGQASVTIVNTPPTQPLVEIRPKPARVGEALVVDVQAYSTDPDGDTVAYDFNWFKSTDGGKTWIHKIELDGSSQVTGPYILDGDLWEVHYIPYEKILTDYPQKSAAPGASAPAAAARVEGKFAWDRAYIGANNPPKLALDQPVARRQASGLMLLNLGWNFSDADGDYCTLDLDWTDLKNSGYQSVARGLSARQGSFNGFVAMPWPWDRPVAIHGVIRDTKGAVAQQISATVRLLPPAPAVVVDYLLGKSANPAGLDANLDRKVTIADVLASGAVALPATPAAPVPADGTRSVSCTPRLAWSGTAHVQSYQLYLWRPREVRPSTPLATLSAGTTMYQVRSALLPGTTYCWQVVAVSGTLKTTGPVWAFVTQ